MIYEIEEEGGSIQFVTIKNDEGELVLSLEEVNNVLDFLKKIISSAPSVYDHQKSPDSHGSVHVRKQKKEPLPPLKTLSDWVTSY